MNFKRLFLRGLKWDAEEQSISLHDALKSAARAQLTETRNGLILIGTAGNGHTVNFSLPGNGGGLTPFDIADLLEDLLRRHEEASTNLVAAGTADPTDDQIFTEMLTLLVPVRAVTHDFGCLRA